MEVGHFWIRAAAISRLVIIAQQSIRAHYVLGTLVVGISRWRLAGSMSQ